MTNSQFATRDIESIRILLEISIAFYALGTIAYHICLLLDLAAGKIIFPFLVFSSIYISLNLNRFRTTFRELVLGNRYLFILIGSGAFLGLILMIISRPDADDVQFFHSALLQFNDLGRPFITTVEIHDVKNMPTLTSIVGAIPFYEHSIILISKVLRLDPLNAYHNISIFIASIGFFLVYTLIYREFGLNRKMAFVAVFCAILFLLLDGNVHRSFGNVTLMRMWQGKAILWTLIVPLSMICTYRFFSKPDLTNYFLVALSAICGLSLSSTGLFLIPAMIFTTSLACVASNGFQFQSIKLWIVINTSYMYATFILLCVILGVFEMHPIETLFRSWGDSWLKNLKLVIPDFPTLMRNLVLLLLVPFVALRAPFNRFLPLITVSVFLCFMNPVTGPLIFEAVTPGSYWRLVYMMPLPLAAGLIGVVVGKSKIIDARSFYCFLIVMVVSILVFATYKNSVIFPSAKQAPVWFKKPFDYRFRADDIEVSKEIADILGPSDHLLAPQRITHVVPLLNPYISLEAARRFQTKFVFAIVGQPDEGHRRTEAQRLVTNCVRSELSDRAIRTSIENGVTAIVVRKCNKKLLESLETLMYSVANWNKRLEENGYILYIRKRVS